MKGERDLPARSFSFAQRVVRLCQELDRQPGVGRVLSRQLVRSGTSVGANIEEGQASRSRADFIATYSIACREARETHYWLRLIAASDLMPRSRIEDLTDEAGQLVAILSSIVINARRNSRKADS